MTYYDDIAESYEELHGEEQLRKAKIVADELNVKENESLLDVGCGTAHYLSLFNCKKVGVDPSIKLLEQSKFNVKQASAESLPFEDNSFDYVISLTAVHNFNNIKKGLEEIKRVGKRIVVLSILKKSSSFKEIERLIKELFVVKKEVDDFHDVIYFCEKN